MSIDNKQLRCQTSICTRSPTCEVGPGGRSTGWPIERERERERAVSKLTWTILYLHISCVVLKRQTVVVVKWRKCLTLGVKYTQVSSVAMLPSCYFAIFRSWSGPNDSNELHFLSHTGVTATTETYVVYILGFHPKN